ncbi:hypothetical protein A5740_15195 [Mycobacterium sp. GA-1841]|nr:hypothetical protein A5740_15195 [Mycobacterium sp. GA-1841]
MAGIATATAVAVGLGPTANASVANAASSNASARHVVSDYGVGLTAASTTPRIIFDIPEALAELGINPDKISLKDFDPAQLGLGELLKSAGIDLSGLVTGMMGEDMPISGDGFNVIMTGPLFGALRALGGNPNWAASTPKDIADAITDTPWGVKITSPLKVTNANWRVPTLVSMGLGAYNAGQAYQLVVDEFKSQDPNNNKTILPMIMLFNPGRANGGLFARFDPVAQMFGFSTVTEDVVSQRTDYGVADGKVRKAVLFPIKVDGTVEYFALSDFPAWANPLALANSAASVAFPTYMLRGTTLDDIINPIMDGALGAIDTKTGIQLTLGNAPAAVNKYVTIGANGLPLLEPLRLPTDAVNLALGTNFTNPIADALEPALKILVNLGYTDVDQENGYERTFDDSGNPVGFGTMPDVDWSRVPADVVKALEAGIEQAFFNGGIPGVPSAPADPKANPLKNIAELVSGGGLGKVSGLGATLSDAVAGKIAGGTVAQEDSSAESDAKKTAVTDKPAAAADAAANTPAEDRAASNLPVKSADAVDSAKKTQGKAGKPDKRAVSSLVKKARDGVKKAVGAAKPAKQEKKQRSERTKKNDSE